MKKFSISLIAVLLLAALMSTSVLGAEFTLKLANTDSTHFNIGDDRYTYYVYGMMKAFKDNLEALSGGRIAVELYTGGVLGDHRTNLESIRIGALEGGTPSEGPVSIFYPEIQVLTIPYVFPHISVAWDVVDGPFGQKLFEGMIDKGFRVVAAGDNGGFRFFANNIRPIYTPADMAGLRIRTMEIPSHMEMVRAMGAAPTPVAWTEVYTALQTGVVDGADLPTIGTLQMNQHEVIDFITVDQHLFSLSMLIISERWFQRLPEDLQNAVIAAGRVAQTVSRGLSEASVSEVMAFYAAQGIEVTYLAPEETAAFAEVVQPAVMEWMAEQVGQELLDEFLEAVEVSKAKFGF